MEVRCNFLALKGFESDGDLIVRGSFFAKRKISCKTLIVEGDFSLDGGELYCQELYVNGEVYIRGSVYMKSEGTITPTSCKVEIGGDCFCEGIFVAHGGEITVNGCFVTTSIARLGYTRLKVMGDVVAQYLDSGELSVCGDIEVKDMVDVKGRIYALGGIDCIDITPNLNNIYCGGKCIANYYSIGRVYEDVTNWKIN